MTKLEFMAVAIAVSFLASRARTYTPPSLADMYLADFRAAEKKHNLPHNLLVRVAQQESYFDPLAESPAGAQGIMQIVPFWHPNVDPFDPHAAIDYAGGYLASLYQRFGSWIMALAAYNWGQGNLERYGLEDAPEETRNYIDAITKDVRLV